VTGEKAQAAQKRPLAVEDIRRQIGKTGDSPFVFEAIDVRMDGEVFLPLQSLNQLRREALSQLETQLYGRYFRHPEKEEAQAGTLSSKRAVNHDADAADTAAVISNGSQSVFGLTVSVQERFQLDTVLAWADHTADGQEESSASGLVHAIYLDAGLLFPVHADGRSRQDAHALICRVQQAGIRCMLQMPPIFRQRERDFYRQEQVSAVLKHLDGFLVRCVDAFAFLRAEGYQQSIIADDSLYAYNHRAAAFWKETGASRLTLPAELNAKELSRLDTEGSEMTVYGRTQLMVTAQCLKKNTSGCTGVPALLYLKDRRQASFPVRTRCSECCNVIYNSVPLDLLDCGAELRKLHPSFLRLAFTAESAQETAEVLGRYESFLAGADVPSGGESRTRGHFRRGVE
jgi:putative protease